MGKDATTSVYLITPPRVDDPLAFAEQLKLALDAGGGDCVQLRLKDADDDTIRRAADVLRPPTQERDVAFIMNDRPDLARETGCDGVHIGQDDARYVEARELLGPDAIIGVTCKASRHLAIDAAEAGADYVAFGAFFGSTTKAGTVQASSELLTWWCETTNVPCVAIGGITPANCGPLVLAGADFLAVISSVWSHTKGPGSAMAEFRLAIAAAAH
ncbi:MAG: Thiamine-phosphate synthase [Alphaproteobacteria bacterium MarineAlpha4_Bin2]|nr:MAG: Thiamine-phosphate synthase [Alphaproteobacteria bacterium MarineAlpha4_Bin2]